MPEQRPAAGPDPASRARMPLIDLITSGALDEEYVEVARRRGAGAGSGSGAGTVSRD